MNKRLKYYSFIFLPALLQMSCGDYPPEQTSSAPVGITTDTTRKGRTAIDYFSAFRANTTTEIGRSINCIFQDKQNNYWFGSNREGVYGYNGHTLYHFTTKDGLCDDQVTTIQEDASGNIWFLTAGGLSRFDGKSFSTLPQKNNPPLPYHLPSKVEPEDLWFETGGGAYCLRHDSLFYLLLAASPLDPQHHNPTDPFHPDMRVLNTYSVYCSLKDKEGNMWFGTQSQGVCRFDGTNFTWFTEKGLAGPAIRALFEDSQGNFWFGNNGNGLFRFDGKSLTNVTEEKGLGNPEFVITGQPRTGTLARPWTIQEDLSGNLWIGSYDSGAWRYDGKDLVNFTPKDGLCGTTITTLFRDTHGLLWIGTDGAGVCTFDGSAFSPFLVGS